ncbi:MAG: radical SAM protein [Marinilabiliales bacterium]
MYKYLFGPVPSRRLGMSLGIDLVPAKVCSLNCVYCEAGKTTKLTTERLEYVPYDKIISELNHYFTTNPDPDYFTFSGSGEPTLNNRIGDVITFLKNKKPDIPVAVLTNGTLLHDMNVRQSLKKSDLVMPSLDAATKETFNKINRPAKEIDFNKYINGLIDFSKKFTGKIWLEIFILPGYNDDEKELEELKKTVLKINPDLIQLNSLDRPGVLENLVKAPDELLLKIKDSWGMDNIQIISSSTNRKKMKFYNSDIENSILQIISRRPCTLEDLSTVLNKNVLEIKKYLDIMQTENKITCEKQFRGVFYKIKQ